MEAHFPPPSGSVDPLRPAIVGNWVHRTSAGIEIGGERPSGKPRGPIDGLMAAFATTWALRRTLWILVLKEFKQRYRAQSLGLVWSFAHPLIMMVTLTIAFDYILRVPIPNFPIFYLIAALFWQWFYNGTLACTGVFIENGGLIKRTIFPRHLLPLASVLSNFLNFLMECVLLVAFYFVFPKAYNFGLPMLALPVLVLIEFMMIFGIGLATSVLNVRYRDVYYMVTSALTIGFWVSPILYTVSLAKDKPWLQTALRLNPLTGVLEGARATIMRGQWPSLTDVTPGAVSAVCLFLIGCAVFRANQAKLSDYV